MAGEWKFAFFGSKGDLEWHVYAYTLKRYYRCNLLCSRCFASQTQDLLLYTNLADDAPWLQTIVRTSAFLANARMQGSLPGLCQIEGWSSESLLWDAMHNIYIGVGRDVAGSALDLLCSEQYYGNLSPSDQLKMAHAAFRGGCRRHGVPCGVPLFEPGATLPKAARVSRVRCQGRPLQVGVVLAC